VTFTGADTILPTMVDEHWYARLPFQEAQAQLGGPGVESPVTIASCGWHGTSLDPERGCFGIVAADGTLADMVGERLSVTRRDGLTERTVFVYVHADSTVLTEDLSLTRRAFLALSELARDDVPVLIRVVAEAVVT